MVSLIWVSRGTHHPLPRRDRHRRWSYHTHRGQDQLECLSYTLFWPQGTFCTLHWSKTLRPGTTSCQKRKEKKDKNPESEHFGAVKTSWEGLHPTYLPHHVVRVSFLNIHVLLSVAFFERLISHWHFVQRKSMAVCCPVRPAEAAGSALPQRAFG